MSKTNKPSAEAFEEVDFELCIHEAAHVIVYMAFGIPVVFVYVTSDEGLVRAVRPPVPEHSTELSKYYWALLCSTVAGHIGEVLYKEAENSFTGDWQTCDEKDEWVRSIDSLCKHLSGDSAPAFRYPEGELGTMIRYAVTMTNQVSTVTASCWWDIAGNKRPSLSNIPSPHSLASLDDKALSLRYSSEICLEGPSAKPFRQPWPAEVRDSDGVSDQIQIIAFAEMEAEQILKREWESVSAVARSLWRRKNHRMTGKQVEAFLRQHKTSATRQK